MAISNWPEPFLRLQTITKYCFQADTFGASVENIGDLCADLAIWCRLETDLCRLDVRLCRLEARLCQLEAGRCRLELHLRRPRFGALFKPVRMQTLLFVALSSALGPKVDTRHATWPARASPWEAFASIIQLSKNLSGNPRVVRATEREPSPLSIKVIHTPASELQHKRF